MLLDVLRRTGRPRSALCSPHQPPVTMYFIPDSTIEAVDGKPVAACNVTATAISNSIREARRLGDPDVVLLRRC
jgi:hypothetical protein